MSRVISYDRPKKILNLAGYIYLTEVRAQTGLIGGKIVYNGKEYTEQEYEAQYPKPVLEYEDKQLDSTIIKK